LHGGGKIKLKGGLMSIQSLTRDTVFEFLRPDQVNELSNAADTISLAAGDLVYQKGEAPTYFFIVLKGQVALRLPGKGGLSILIDELGEGGIFGSCVSFALHSYALTARCTENCDLLRIKASVLQGLLDQDPRMGYAIQSKISEIYFRRYVEAMNKLQAIIMNIPLQPN
jgi:CRP-like cAMP-binding protein